MHKYVKKEMLGKIWDNWFFEMLLYEKLPTVSVHG